MLLPQLLITLVFFLCGIVMMKFPPKTINPLYGYRTRASMQNEEAWRFAQRLSARRFILIGMLSAVVLLLEWILDLNEPWTPLIMILSLLGGFYYLFKSVEKKLAQRFSRQ